MGALSDYVSKKFGVPTRSVYDPVTQTPGAGVTLVLQNNPDRLMCTVINFDAVAMYLGFDSEVSATNGVYLGPSGGSVTLTADEDAELVGEEVYLYSAAGGNIKIIVVEGG